MRSSSISTSPSNGLARKYASSFGKECGEGHYSDFLSERLKLEDINAAFDRLAAGESIRQVVEID